MSTPPVNTRIEHARDLAGFAFAFVEVAGEGRVYLAVPMINAAKFIAGDSNAGMYAALFVRSLPILTANGFDQLEVTHG